MAGIEETVLPPGELGGNEANGDHPEAASGAEVLSGTGAGPTDAEALVDGGESGVSKRKREEGQETEEGEASTDEASASKRLASDDEVGKQEVVGASTSAVLPEGAPQESGAQDNQYAQNYLAQFDQAYRGQLAANGSATSSTPTPAIGSNPGDASATIKEIVECPPNLVGRVIGRGGETIRDLQSRSGCEITINQDLPEGQNRQVIITGNKVNVEAAKSMVHIVMDSVSDAVMIVLTVNQNTISPLFIIILAYSS